jgi:peptidoglycan/LPS O-acetylase OafA/YrhL
VSLHNLARIGFAVTALAVLLAPWYRLDDYVPNGWDASWWVRLAFVAALAGLALASTNVNPQARIMLAVVAVGAIAFRLAIPPDFGFAFDGLDVPTERRVGAPLGLAGALLVLVAELLQERRARTARSPGSPRSGTAEEASASGPAGPAPA